MFKAESFDLHIMPDYLLKHFFSLPLCRETFPDQLHRDPFLFYGNKEKKRQCRDTTSGLTITRWPT